MGIFCLQARFFIAWLKILSSLFLYIMYSSFLLNYLLIEKAAAPTEHPVQPLCLLQEGLTSFTKLQLSS